MKTHEHTINDAVAKSLKNTRFAWRADGVVSSETGGLFKKVAKRPDICIVEPNCNPVIIEAEIMPARGVEKDATERLGHIITKLNAEISVVVAIRYPREFIAFAGEKLAEKIESSHALDMAVYYKNDATGTVRWPEEGWITGCLEELSMLCQHASMPPQTVEKATNYLESGVLASAGLLNRLEAGNLWSLNKIAEELHQVDTPQTRRMAATIIANAFVVHQGLARGAGPLAEVRSLEEVCRNPTQSLKEDILQEWKKILVINYWSIFDIASRILRHVPTNISGALVDELYKTALKLVEARLTKSHDLIGAVFQKLIADRKFLAAYYTTPSSSALLSTLVLETAEVFTDKSNKSVVRLEDLRFADFACGTGTLLSMIYSRACQLHELQGADARSSHSEMMSQNIVGCDVLPAATHLTASMLSGIHPGVTYAESSIFTVPYGRQSDDSFALGSIDLLQENKSSSFIDPKASGLDSHSGKQTHIWEKTSRFSCDIIVMNPPFTRATNHDASNKGVPSPMFAAFESTKEDQKKMTETFNLVKKLCPTYHGNAGEASIFASLAHVRLKVSGTLGLIMPLTLLAGDSWQKSRTMFFDFYKNLIVVSIAGSGSKSLSFSADTGMGECILVGTKSRQPKKENTATFVVLKRAPLSSLEGAAMGQAVKKLLSKQAIARLEDGPSGGTPVLLGKTDVGTVVSVDLDRKRGWAVGRVADISVAQAAYQLVTRGVVWLPGMAKQDQIPLPTTSIEAIATVGPYHADIDQWGANKSIRGPFDVSILKVSKQTPTYPLLWAHDADRERCLTFEADCEAIPKKAQSHQSKVVIEEKVQKIWQTASFCHFNQDFQFNSQSTAMQYTSRRTIGGHAWISIRMKNELLEKALVLWGNTILGLLSHWWQSSKQQAGRGRLGVSLLRPFVSLDVTSLSIKQLKASKVIFSEMKNVPLKPFNEIACDSNRERLDRRFLGDVLGLPAAMFVTGGCLDVLRQKLAGEPTVAGSKKISSKDLQNPFKFAGKVNM